MNMTESGYWAMAIIRLWADDAELRKEFDCVVDFDFWADEVSENLIRSASAV
jgi:hypothetical protein